MHMWMCITMYRDHVTKVCHIVIHAHMHTRMHTRAHACARTHTFLLSEVFHIRLAATIAPA